MALSRQQVAQYHEDGFLLVEDLFKPSELQPVMDEISGLVDDLAERLYQAGKIADRHADKDFYHRLTALEKEFKGAAVLIHTNGWLGPELARLWSAPRLLDIIEQFIGPDIAGHPVWNIRSKTPDTKLMTVPWHQDTAYLAPGAEHTLQPTAWIPFIDANAVNGGLEVLRGGHRSGKVARHKLENTAGSPGSWYLYVEDTELPQGEPVSCDMRIGSVLFLNQLVPHRSRENRSDKIRWSVDLRYQDPKLPSGDQGGSGVIVMRKADDPSFHVDWDSWAAEQRVAYERQRGLNTGDPFSTRVSGMWMDRWRELA
jgi:ectoine hydroxylase-related dioxygenase (phytanoyl-CoA dioxygenase family)